MTVDPHAGLERRVPRRMPRRLARWLVYAMPLFPAWVAVWTLATYPTDRVSRAALALDRAERDQIRADTRLAAAQAAWDEVDLLPEEADVRFARWCLGSDDDWAVRMCSDGERHMTAQEAERVLARTEPAVAWGRLELESRALADAELGHDQAQERIDRAVASLEHAQRAQESWERALWGNISLAIGGALLALGGAGALRVWVPPLRIRITRHAVELGSRRIEAHELVRCEVSGSALVLHLVGRQTYRTPGLALSPGALERLADEISGIALTLEQRKEVARARVDMERQRSALSSRITR